MQLSDTLKPTVGVWTFTAYEGDKELDEDGAVLNPVVWEQTKTNLIVTTGKQLILDRLFGLSAAVALSGMAVGTSATAAAAGDTAITGAAYKAFASAPTRFWWCALQPSGSHRTVQQDDCRQFGRHHPDHPVIVGGMKMRGRTWI
jgi:hypothetical protein